MAPSEGNPMRWVWRGVALVILLAGWLFIFIKNNFHITVPVVMVGLAYLAVVAAVVNLYRIGAAAAEPEDASEAAWVRPMGARDELEREKKTLLKAIKDTEFDHAMGKLSKVDADDMIRTYRARAIEIIKELDRMDGMAGTTVREQIEKEIAARVQVDNVPPKAGGKKDKRKKAAAPETPSEPATEEAHTASEEPKEATP